MQRIYAVFVAVLIDIKASLGKEDSVVSLSSGVSLRSVRQASATQLTAARNMSAVVAGAWSKQCIVLSRYEAIDIV
ncbi:hypothetical protein CLAFUW4_20031 [Fulvia fulva]|uniref:uncharacterized protein n=1 Tax=Passalora fulva TaxID=5499 RepID=UPI0028526E34|nr:uncharacterized protein CLAFUR5_20031 [Fulvia fulva]KAK4626386.1 hypothetical protein CLAFUR4_20031 [Fulvia fulva]KAK4628532.1 hypothetical protein CLAFUR0_20031 [Fulvia fulva]WMI38855.1 hypothetical protein CLAFUR5_20031 [Fulvia fulva]WPV13999.1 hypothetical protein CLAFUW4_20031 [Fulvia fulva]WPV28528.1 hypothetical protein CLAFUW7_20031 [Fulvia fulva]